tara:strand:+ start:1092 stop:1571 length:480 start_codon:yes stop_codon:yes gene_type:complete
MKNNLMYCLLILFLAIFLSKELAKKPIIQRLLTNKNNLLLLSIIIGMTCLLDTSLCVCLLFLFAMLILYMPKKEGFFRSSVPVNPNDSFRRKNETFNNTLNADNNELVEGSYDVAGCRMDNHGKFKEEHDTPYGKALDDCSNYSNAKLEKTGTLFYPLN